QGYVGDGKACATCKAGFSPVDNKCVDDCHVGNGGCDARARCGHNSSGVTCSCPVGFITQGMACADACTVDNGGCGTAGCGHAADGAIQCLPHYVSLSQGQASEYQLGNLTIDASFACGVQVDRTLWCWGNNRVQQVSDGVTDFETPLQEGTDTDW